MSEDTPAKTPAKNIAAHINLNVMNTLVLDQPIRYHAVYPIGYTLKSAQLSDSSLALTPYPSLSAADARSNTTVRFEDDWGDEEKFTEPMKRYPAASLELLLNGLYPLKAEFELMPVEKKLVGRNRGPGGLDLYEMK